MFLSGEICLHGRREETLRRNRQEKRLPENSRRLRIVTIRERAINDGKRNMVTGSDLFKSASRAAMFSINRQKSAYGVVVNARGNARIKAKAGTFHREEPRVSQV